MTGLQVVGWALIAAVCIVIDGLAVAFVVIFIRSAFNSSRPSNPYRSRSHE
jgi:hypothetical protein